MKTSITQQELNDMVLSHDRGGNGWVMVHDFGDDYCKIAQLMKGGKIGNQAFLAWKPCLSVDTYQPQATAKDRDPKRQPLAIPKDTKIALQELRADLASGKLVIQNTRFVAQQSQGGESSPASLATKTRG